MTLLSLQARTVAVFVIFSSAHCLKHNHAHNGGSMLAPGMDAVQDAYTTKRIDELLTPTLTNTSCGGFETWGRYCRDGDEFQKTPCDYASAWCNRALHETLKKNPVGFSFGIFTFDDWSQALSANHSLKTELYDCFTMGDTISGKYPTPYRMHNTCLSNHEFADSKGRKFETLSQQLEGRSELSALVKIDVEGWEWPVLRDLFDNHPEDLNKIALLDLELHFCQDMEKAEKAEGNDVSKTPMKQIPILEKLTDYFAVNYFTKSMWNAYTRSFNGCVGAPATMGNLNLVNRKLMGTWDL